MGKSFNELSGNLKALIKDLNSDAHNARSFKEEHYNNMKMSMDPQKESRPHVTITISMSEATYSIDTGERLKGSLGPDEKYVIRWLKKSGVIDNLKEMWKEVSKKDKNS